MFYDLETFFFPSDIFHLLQRDKMKVFVRGTRELGLLCLRRKNKML